MAFPKLIVFDLDHTLWPFDCSKDAVPPFSVIGGYILDAYGKQANPYQDVPDILSALINEGIPVAFASRNPDAYSIEELLRAIPLKTRYGTKCAWDVLPSAEYFHAYSRGTAKGKDKHFEAIKRISGVEFSDMLFFDDFYSNIECAEEQGTTSVCVTGGMTWNIFMNGIAKWRAVKMVKPPPLNP